MNYDT